jgi:hypothetical protein
MMSYEFNLQELEKRLAQCLECGGLREILAKAGIPESEPVKLSIKSGDMDVITDYVIPTTNPPVPVTPTKIDFNKEIRNFLDDAESFNFLLSALPPSEELPGETLKTSFKFNFKSSSMIIESQGSCCGRPCRIC